MYDFKSLKNRNSDFFDKVSKVMKSSEKKFVGEDDNTYWQPTIGKDGNGYAVVRFLPAPADEDVPFIIYYDHGFKGPGGWYIERSRTSLGEDDPVTEHNSLLWDSGEAGKKLVQGDGSKERPGRKRRKHFVSNILVINDPAKPECNGKVYRYKYGTKIYEKLNAAMHPVFPGVAKINPFDPYENGANFNIRITIKDGYLNYDHSSFDNPEALKLDVKALTAIENSLYSLQAELAPEKYKSYDELKRRFERVIGEKVDAVHQTNEERIPTKVLDTPSRPMAAQKSIPVSNEIPFDIDSGGDQSDDSLEFFERLANRK